MALLTSITLPHKLPVERKTLVYINSKKYNEEIVAQGGKVGIKEEKSRKFPKYANEIKWFKINHRFFILK